HFEKQLNRWLDGDLAAPEVAAIQRELAEDPEARQVYYELLMVDRLLDERAEARPESVITMDAIASQTVLGRKRKRLQMNHLAIAALVVLGLFVSFLDFRRQPAEPATTGPLITGSTDSRMTIAQRQDSSRWGVGELLRLE